MSLVLIFTFYFIYFLYKSLLNRKKVDLQFRDMIIEQ